MHIENLALYHTVTCLLFVSHIFHVYIVHALQMFEACMSVTSMHLVGGGGAEGGVPP